VGVRSVHLQILEEELLEVAHEVYWATDDGSAGFHGTVVDLMRDIYDRSGRAPAFVHVIGPVALMRAAAELTREWGVRTVASLNPIMVDGTGMCGGCRATVGGKPVFVCVDGPEFDAHQVDFNELALRNCAYLKEEKLANECAITG
jgi:ferredoxin--NADP+ reductase